MAQKKTHEIYADFYGDVPSGGKRMAAAHGVHNDTAVAWARPKASDINPTATGKNNPLDGAARSMGVMHPHDPLRAREIVAFFEQRCDELDRNAGLREATLNDHPCAALAAVISRQAELMTATLDCENDGNLAMTLKKTMALKSSVIRLESCLKILAKEGKHNLCETTENTETDEAAMAVETSRTAANEPRSAQRKKPLKKAMTR